MNGVSSRVFRIVGKIFVLILLAASAVSSASAQAQASAADLTGTVVDPNGAVVAGATVTARKTGTGIQRVATSDEDGTYRLIGLPPGEYEVTAEAPTFKKVSISGVRLTVGQAAELRISMEIGTPDLVVNVPAESLELIETTKTNVSTTIDQASIETTYALNPKAR